MAFGYFYEADSDQFVFYRIPKVLFTNEVFSKLSTEAKVLYGLLLDRVSLSKENHWVDEKGRVYIIFTLKSIQQSMGCSDRSATKYLKELEDCGLIERIRQGQGRPMLIYVKNFCDPKELRFQTRKNFDSRVEEFTSLDPKELRPNNTNINNTEGNNINPILSADSIGYEILLDEQIGYQYLLEEFPYDEEILFCMRELILEVLCSRRDTIRIAGEERPTGLVKSRFLKLEMSHIRYVMDCFKGNSTKIRNIKQYLLTALYNAPTTIGSYYQAEVAHDIASGKI